VQITEWWPEAAPEDERRQWYDVWSAGYRELRPDDPVPPYATALGWYSIHPAYTVARTWLARSADGRVTGWAQLTRDTNGTNQHRAECELGVAQDARRSGVGTALLRALAGAAQQAGCTVLGFEVERADAAAFLDRFGGKRCVGDARGVLQTADVDRSDVAACAQRPAGAADYSLLCWDDGVPDEWLGELARVVTAMNDAPVGEMAWNDEEPDPDRVRGWHTMLSSRGDMIWTVCARHEPTGRLAGVTELVFYAGFPERAYQESTAVDPRHRGHGLGLWMKATMLQRVLAVRPEVTSIETGNADVNEHMLRINRRLGFRTAAAAAEHELDTAAALARLAG
jgi:GNAT superfamily N-acetyltransferase